MTAAELKVGTEIQYRGWKQKPEETEARKGTVKSVARKWVEITRDNGKHDWATVDNITGPFGVMTAGEENGAESSTEEAQQEETPNTDEEGESPKPSTEEQPESVSVQAKEEVEEESEELDEEASDLEEGGVASEVEESEQPAAEVHSKKSAAKPKKNNNKPKKAKGRRR